jgi:hypothetical protein
MRSVPPGLPRLSGAIRVEVDLPAVVPPGFFVLSPAFFVLSPFLPRLSEVLAATFKTSARHLKTQAMISERLASL